MCKEMYYEKRAQKTKFIKGMTPKFGVLKNRFVINCLKYFYKLDTIKKIFQNILFLLDLQ